MRKNASKNLRDRKRIKRRAAGEDVEAELIEPEDTATAVVAQGDYVDRCVYEIMLAKDLIKRPGIRKVFPKNVDPAEVIMSLLESFSEGATPVEAAAELGVTFATLSKWAKKYPKIQEAFFTGRLLAQAWWYRKARDNVDNRYFNVGLWNQIMTRYFGAADSGRAGGKDNDSTGEPQGIPGSVTEEEDLTPIDVAALSLDELELLDKMIPDEEEDD